MDEPQYTTQGKITHKLIKLIEKTTILTGNEKTDFNKISEIIQELKEIINLILF